MCRWLWSAALEDHEIGSTLGRHHPPFGSDFSLLGRGFYSALGEQSRGGVGPGQNYGREGLSKRHAMTLRFC